MRQWSKRKCVYTSSLSLSLCLMQVLYPLCLLLSQYYGSLTLNICVSDAYMYRAIMFAPSQSIYICCCNFAISYILWSRFSRSQSLHRVKWPEASLSLICIFLITRTKYMQLSIPLNVEIPNWETIIRSDNSGHVPNHFFTLLFISATFLHWILSDYFTTSAWPPWYLYIDIFLH